jgi:hypothetical protein
MMLVRIDAQLGWEVARDLRSDRWVGLCRPLGITAEAETWEKLAGAMGEVVNELMRDLLADGELPAFLKDLGWQSSAETPIPKVVPPEGIAFDVPMDILVKSASELSCAHAQA